MDPTQQMMLQALSQGQTTGTPKLAGGMSPYAFENQLQMMRRLGSPLYANSPLRSGNSSIVPTANPYNQQAAQAFAPVQQQQRPQ
jgi:hypothetical protein